VVLTIVVALLGASGLASIPPVDRDEPDFAQPARQMLESGDFVAIRFQDTPLHEKPVLTYWLQAGSAALFGGPERNRIAAYRLPSVLAIWIATLLTYELALVFFDARIALSAGLLFASSPLAQSQAHQARADALLVAAMLGAIVPLARVYASRASPAASGSSLMNALFWISLAAGILIKGPVVPVLIVLAVVTMVLLERDWRCLLRLQPGWGIPLFLLLLLPWPVALLRSTGASFFVEAWTTDIFPKLVSAQESHGAPPLTLALLAPLTLWPATLLLPSAMEHAWRGRRDLPVRFLLASILPGWLLFELAVTKLPHYVLPFVPMLAVLAAASASPWVAPAPSRIASRLGVVLFAVAGLAIAGGIVVALVRLGTGLDIIAGISVAALAAFVIVVAGKSWAQESGSRAGSAALCGILASLMIFGIAMPRLERLWVADRAARAAASVAQPGVPVLVVGYHEPSLVFLLGTRTRLVDAETAASALAAHQSAVAIVAGTSISEFLRLARARALDLQSVARVDGIDPVHGHPLELEIWKIPPLKPAS